MRGFKVENKDGKFIPVPVNIEDFLDEDGDLYWDKVFKEDITVLEDGDDKIYVLEYNGRVITITPWLEQIEDEYEDEVVEALKRDGYFREIEYCDDPDDDDEVHEFRLTTLTV